MQNSTIQGNSLIAFRACREILGTRFIVIARRGPKTLLSRGCSRCVMCGVWCVEEVQVCECYFHIQFPECYKPRAVFVLWFDVLPGKFFASLRATSLTVLCSNCFHDSSMFKICFGFTIRIRSFMILPRSLT